MIVLELFGNRTYIITEMQRDMITGYIEAGTPKAFKIGENTVIVNQIAGMPELETYRRQLKEALARDGKRMCKRCGMIVGRLDACPCKERPERYPDLLDIARAENPKLADTLNAIAQDKAMKLLPHVSHVA